MKSITRKIEIEFTDERITPSGGSVFVHQVALRLGLPSLLENALHLKVRNRGASDVEMMLSLIYTLANGDGAISDVDRLAFDTARREIMGLERVPGHRRLGEYLTRFHSEALESFYGVARHLAGEVAPLVMEHELSEKGYIPVFTDGSGIEVYGEYFEKSGPLYNGEKGFWLHGVFVGSLWVAQRFLPGGVDVAEGWRELLDEAAEVIKDRGPVWVFLDSAYYRWEVVKYLRERGWDFSISVTDPRKKQPIVEITEVLSEEEWKPIRGDNTEHATYVYYRPSGWEEEQVYVVIRSRYEGPQGVLFPCYTVILSSGDDLPVEEVVRRHRRKQGLENAFKGPLIHLDLHHPPCQRFNANRAFYVAGQIAQILLVGLQFKLLPEEARGHSIRTIIRDLVRTGAKLVRKARKLILKFSKHLPDRSLIWINHAAGRVERWGYAPT